MIDEKSSIRANSQQQIEEIRTETDDAIILWDEGALSSLQSTCGGLEHLTRQMSPHSFHSLENFEEGNIRYYENTVPLRGDEPNRLVVFLCESSSSFIRSSCIYPTTRSQTACHQLPPHTTRRRTFLLPISPLPQRARALLGHGTLCPAGLQAGGLGRLQPADTEQRGGRFGAGIEEIDQAAGSGRLRWVRPILAGN